MVKDDITCGIYANFPCVCVIQLGLLIADPNAKYGLRGSAMVITLSTYIDAFIYRPAIIAVGIPYGYYLPPWGREKFGRTKGLGFAQIGCVTLRVVGITAECGRETTTSGNTFENDTWLIT